MKNSIKVSLLVVLLLTLTLITSGCGFFNHPGKTASEVNREHRRMLRVNQQELMSDVDRAVHLDRPSTLTEMRIAP